MPDNTGLHTSTCKCIVSYIFLMGGWCYKALGGVGVRRGLPDISGCLKGRAVYIEVKTGKGVQTVEQKREQARIEDAGGIYILAHTIEDVEDRLVAEGLVRPSLYR